MATVRFGDRWESYDLEKVEHRDPAEAERNKSEFVVMVKLHHPHTGEKLRFLLSDEEYRRVRQPDFIGYPDTEVERSNQEIPAPTAARAALIDADVRAYAEFTECGDEECHTCHLGVANGLETLDAAFQAGHKAAEADYNSSGEDDS